VPKELRIIHIGLSLRRQIEDQKQTLEYTSVLDLSATGIGRTMTTALNPFPTCLAILRPSFIPIFWVNAPQMTHPFTVPSLKSAVKFQTKLSEIFLVWRPEWRWDLPFYCVVVCVILEMKLFTDIH